MVSSTNKINPLNRLKTCAFLTLLFLNSCGFPNEDLKEIESSKFEDMLRSGDVRKLVLVENEKQIEITLTPEALQSPKYKLELEGNRFFDSSVDGPHCKMQIGSIDKFLHKYEDITKDIPREQKIDLRFEERSDSPDLLFNWGLMLIPIFGLITWILVHRYLSKANKTHEVNQGKDLESGMTQKATSRYRYPALRTIAGIYMACAWITSIAAVTIAFYLVRYQGGWMAFLSLVVGGLAALGLTAISESIKVFLDIEYNTRKLTDDK
jgi:hypothetical protein